MRQYIPGMSRKDADLCCLGIETSCDETSLALVRSGKLIGHVLASQSDLHALFGGVVPELASREHYRFICVLFDELLAQSGIDIHAIDCIAVSRGPGLLGSLLVGVAFAKALAFGIPARLLAVNHLHAHLLSCGLSHSLIYPSLGLLISGGHTNIYRIESPLHFILLGRTLDDACGEVYDKIGTLLGMQYPSGTMVDKAAHLGTHSFAFTLPYMDNENLDFSFSGLKTAVATKFSQLYPQIPWKRPVTDVSSLPKDIHDLCASLNYTVAQTLCRKLERAFLANPDIRSLLMSGGVAANTCIRDAVKCVADKYGASLSMPERQLCTDNGAMVAYTGWLQASLGAYHMLTFPTVPRGQRIPDDYLLDDESRAGTSV